MGLLDKLLKPTPFYNTYQDYKKRKAERVQEALEAKYHPLRVRFYKQFLNKGDTVFDVGANVGNRVQAFLECQTSVIAVEPQPHCASILKEKFGSKIKIEQIGLGSVPGSLEMFVSTDSTISTFSKDYVETTKDRFKYSQWVDKIEVPIDTLDNLIQKHGVPKFCKIDVEGFELEVLKGLNQAIPVLSIEYCVPEVFDPMVACLNRLHEISPNGLFNYSIGESMEWAQSKWLSHADFINHVSTSEFKASSFGDIYFKAD